MSHVVAIETRIKDLAAAQAAAVFLGGELRLGQQNYKWFGRYMADYHADDAAYKRGIKPEDYGKCDHAIHFPDCQYEVGLRLMPEGDYVMIFDFWNPEITTKMGGKAAEGFLQRYAAEKAKLEARKKGYKVAEQKLADGSIKLSLHK